MGLFDPIERTFSGTEDTAPKAPSPARPWEADRSSSSAIPSWSRASNGNRTDPGGPYRHVSKPPWDS